MNDTEPKVDRGASQTFAPTLLKWLAAAWLGASLLFAHGCHGNEDHELFAAITRWF